MATYFGTSANNTITPTFVSSGVTWNGGWWFINPQHWVYDYLYGYGGNDILDGGSGSDYMNGGDGNDTYYVNSTGDTVVEQYDDVLGGVDQVYSTVSYTLTFGVENLTLQGAAAINATGNAKNNILMGNSGANVLNGLGGADAMNGGDGNDTYYVNNIGDTVSESWDDSLAGVDQVYSTVSFTLASMIENLTLQGAAAINATGNAKNNILMGNSGANVLNGLGGADVLQGGAGKDILIGGAGSDDFVFLAVSDSSPSSTMCDVISGGFAKGYDDIVVSNIDAHTGLAGNQAFALDTNGSFSAGEIRQTVLKSGLLIEFNTNSDANVEMAIFIQGLASKLAATDFEL